MDVTSAIRELCEQSSEGNASVRTNGENDAVTRLCLVRAHLHLIARCGVIVEVDEQRPPVICDVVGELSFHRGYFRSG